MWHDFAAMYMLSIYCKTKQVAPTTLPLFLREAAATCGHTLQTIILTLE